MDKFCVCGARVEANTGGYDCPRCFRHYNVNGKLIGNNQMIQFKAGGGEVSDKLIQCPRCGDPITNELGDNPICGACALGSELNVKTLQARIAELEAENAIFRAADYEALKNAEVTPIYCARCGDGIVADDDGICGVCAGAQDGVIENLQNKVAELNVKTLESENAKLTMALEIAAEYIAEFSDWCPRLTKGVDWCPHADAGCPYMDRIDHQQCWLDWLMNNNNQNKGDKNE